jgi:hypothetical protein
MKDTTLADSQGILARLLKMDSDAGNAFYWQSIVHYKSIPECAAFNKMVLAHVEGSTP